MEPLSLSVVTHPADAEFTHALALMVRDAGAFAYISEPGLHEPALERARRESSIHLFIVSPAALASPDYLVLCREAVSPRYASIRRAVCVVLAADISVDNLPDDLRHLPRIEAAPGVAHDPAEALRLTMQAVGLASSAPGALDLPLPLRLVRGKALWAQSRATEALPIFRRITHDQPESLDAWLSLSYMVALLKMGVEAQHALACVQARAPDEYQVQRQSGLIAFAGGQYAIALQAYERVLEIEPDNFSNRMNRAHALARLKRLEEALAAIDFALMLDPHNVHGRLYKVAYLTQAQRINEALALCDQLLAANFLLHVIYHQKGNVLESHQRRAEALATYTTACTLTPNIAYLWNDLARVNYQLKHYPEAFDANTRSLMLDETQAKYWNLRSVILAMLGLHEEALAANDEAVRRDPKMAAAWQTRRYVLHHLGRLREELVAIGTFSKLAPKTYQQQIRRGWRYYASLAYTIIIVIGVLALLVHFLFYGR